LKKSLFILFLLSSLHAHAQKQVKINTLNLDVNSSFRGLSVVDDNVIWVCGSNGYVGRSIDGGKTFKVNKVHGYDTLDFRDIEAFDDQNAIVMNAGSPAYFLKTNNGGQTWKTAYVNKQKQIFFDGMDFWNDKKGIAFSDPIDGKLFLIKTEDGGKAWEEIPFKDCPQVQQGEAGFAASGTSIRLGGDGFAWIGTGGKATHVFVSENYGRTWKKNNCPMVKYKESTGIFSLAFKDARTGIVIGGDYMADSLRKDICFLTYDGCKSWNPPSIAPHGYRSCIEYLNLTLAIATGPTGTDISYDGGNTWKKISDTGFNVVRKAKRGTAVFLAGKDGVVGRIE
jgi:photosystem II stability/assembly factor-like uncharacterized protein